MFLPYWHYSLYRSENSRKRSLWQYQGWLTSVCERWLFPGTQHRTQYNDGSVLEIMLWRYTLVPWELERSLAGSVTLIHTPEVTCQGWKTWETGGVCSPVSAEYTWKAASYNDFCKVRASSALSASSVIQKHDQPFRDKHRQDYSSCTGITYTQICIYSCKNEQ